MLYKVKFQGLLLALFITFILSVFNWYQEGHFQGFFLSCFGAIFGASSAVLIYWFVSSKRLLPTLPFRVAALLAVLFSLIVYGYYAFNGPAENSSSSAAQMHIVIAPFLTTLISFLLLSLAMVVAMVQKLVRQNFE